MFQVYNLQWRRNKTYLNISLKSSFLNKKKNIVIDTPYLFIYIITSNLALGKPLYLLKYAYNSTNTEKSQEEKNCEKSRNKRSRKERKEKTDNTTKKRRKLKWGEKPKKKEEEKNKWTKNACRSQLNLSKCADNSTYATSLLYCFLTLHSTNEL